MKSVYERLEHEDLIDFIVKRWVYGEILPKRLSKERLVNRYKAIIMDRFAGNTLKQCGKNNGVSSERVRQIFASFQRRLKQYVKKEYL